MLSFLAANWPVLVGAITATLATIGGLLKGATWLVLALRAKQDDIPAVARALSRRDEPDKPVT